MVTTIQPVEIPQNFDHLFNKDDPRYNNTNKDPEFIVIEICSRQREIAFQRKISFINSHFINEDGQLATSQKKVENYHKKFGISCDGVAVLLNTGAALGGGAVFTAFGGGFTQISKHHSEITQGNITGLDHHYQRMSSLGNEYSQLKQKTDRDSEQFSSMIDRIMQNSFRIFELMASSTA